MTFVLTLPPHAELDAETVEAGSERGGLVKLGFDDRTEVVYTLFVGLSPAILYWPGGYELFFRILTYDPRDRTTGEFNDGLESRYAIPNPDHRWTIAIAIASFSTALVAQVRPELVFVQTRMPQPDKALVKYGMVLETVAKQGYHIKPEEPFHGRQSWKLERV